MEQIKRYQVQLDRELSKYPQIVKISEQCNVPKTYLVEGVAGFVILLLFFNVWGQLFSNLVAWGYPAYASFKAIETAKKDDDTQWLTYWTVLGFIHTLEFFSDNILSWLPSYFFLKTLFFLWLFMPQTKGAQKLYTGFLRPTLLTYEKDVDSQLNRVKTKYM
ncbi:5332_t:CDS:2 [Funneliformis mosseae]|uniref:Protein YOP1 n=1 Tax=Funneliformis mosseae TaxID=27381 RepID=A0A9N8WLR1_FUNMO|nr:5332_t:CDS:2 [Funneliformis mosseae]